MKIGWRVYFGLLLIALSALLYLVHFDIFHDLSHIAIYGLGTSPFSRSRCFSSSLSLTGSSAGKNSGINLSKLNMVIGVYFNEVGTPLLKAFSDFDPHVGRIRDELLVKGTWKSREFADASLRLKKHEYKLVYEKDDPKAVQFLENLCSFLTRADVFLLRLLENPNLLEQESFTEQLWAVFHVADELQYRSDLAHLPDTTTDISLLTQDGRTARSPLSG